MLRKIREALEAREEGFTLIELLVVVIIIGILAAIAIPVFLNQRQKAYTASAEADARNAALAVESYFTDNDSYPTTGASLTDSTVMGGDAVETSANVTLTYLLRADGTYCINAEHSQTTTTPDAQYDSGAGGIQSTAATCS